MVVEALTGRRPYSGKTYHELLTNMLQQTFHLQDQSPEAQRLDALLQQCLAKERSERIASAADLQYELINAIRHCPVLAPRQAANLNADTIILKQES
jgi:serine/threonine protein kinase